MSAQEISNQEMYTILCATKGMNLKRLIMLQNTVKAEMEKRRETIKAASANWEAPPEGLVRNWYYKENIYLRDAENNVWHVDSRNGDLGSWKGLYLPDEDRINSDADEP
jgi:hypothetical protein